MRKLNYYRSLEGEHETITAMDFRKSPGEVFDQVALGKTFTITKQGKPIATIGPVEPSAVELGAAARRLGLVRQ